MNEKLSLANKKQIKEYIDSCSIKVVKRIDINRNIIEYNDSLKKGREPKTKDVGDEEYTRAFLLTELVNKYGYSIEKITIEASYTMGRVPESRPVFLDLRVGDSNDDAYLFMELKSPDEYETEMENSINKQLFSISTHEAEHNHRAKYLVYYTIEITDEEVLDNCMIIDKDEYSTYEEWEQNRNYLNQIPSHYGKAIKKPFIKGSEKDLISNYSENAINSMAVKLHNVLWGGGSSSDNDIFTSLTNIILAKIEDEDNTGDGEEYKFQSLAFDNDEDEFESDEVLYDRINSLYKDALKNRMNISDQNVINESNVINKNKFSLKKLKYTVQSIEKYSFRSKDGAIINKDILGDFFEGIIRNDYKQSKGQFFTPLNIVNFMFYGVQADNLAISMINKQRSLPFMIDCSAGSGTFLIEYMKNLTQSIKDNREKIRRTPQINGKLLEWFPEYAENKWAQNYVYGTELNFDLGTAIKVNMILHGDGSANVFTGTQYGDGLLEFKKYKKRASDGTERDNNELEKENTSTVYDKKVNEHFDLIMTNPPFSIDLDDETKKTIDNNFVFADKKNSENLFIERYYQLLKPNGRMAVVLPESVFDTTENKYIRTFIYKYFKIKAIVSLPQTTFAFTNTKTSILFAQKKTIDEILEWNEVWKRYTNLYEKLKTRVENIQNVFIHDKNKAKYPSIKEMNDRDMKNCIIDFLDGIIEEDDKQLGLKDLLCKYDYELNDSKSGLLKIDKDTISIAGYCNSYFVLRRVLKELDYQVYMKEVEHVGYKNKKRQGKIILKPDINELYNSDENGKMILDDDSLLSDLRKLEWDGD